METTALYERYAHEETRYYCCAVAYVDDRPLRNINVLLAATVGRYLLQPLQPNTAAETTHFMNLTPRQAWFHGG